jgi:hypothetical protein
MFEIHDEKLEVIGEMFAVGDMDEQDAPTIIGVPAVQIRLADGRIVTVTGLDRDEARTAANHFGKNVAITLALA